LFLIFLLNSQAYYFYLIKQSKVNILPPFLIPVSAAHALAAKPLLLPYPRMYVRQLNNTNPIRNRQDSRLRRKPLWWPHHCIPAFKVSAQKGMF
jgi:hypothetical protein